MKGSKSTTRAVILFTAMSGVACSLHERMLAYDDGGTGETGGAAAGSGGAVNADGAPADGRGGYAGALEGGMPDSSPRDGSVDSGGASGAGNGTGGAAGNGAGAGTSGAAGKGAGGAAGSGIGGASGSAGNGGGTGGNAGTGRDASAGAGGVDAGPVDAPLDLGPTCPTGQKICNGVCVTTSDPANGCAQTTCAPCAFPNAAAVCSGSGQCSLGTCSVGFANCITTDPKDGCETDLSKVDSCGSCTTKCAATAPLCSGSNGSYQCVTGCSAPTSTLCSSQCVDLNTNVSHCGNCATSCATPANGNVSCVNGSCVPTCNTNYHACTTNNVTTCADDNSPSTCGTSCTACPAPTDPNADPAPTCVNKQCGSKCKSGYSLCGGVCSVLNACGGCGTLPGTVGGSCGACGVYACNTTTHELTCNDPGATNMCPTWCTGRAAPAGVAAGDYQCVDFDRDMPPASTWPTSVTGSGVLTRTNARASSPSYSLMSTVAANQDNTATIAWNDVGSTPITSLSISAAVSPTVPGGVFPPGSGGMDMLCLASGGNKTCLEYTLNGDSPSANFTGLYIYWQYIGGAAVADMCELSVTSLPANIWSTVTLSITVATAEIVVTINGATSTSNCVGKIGSDTVAKMTVGGTTHSYNTFPWSGYFDNIEAAVRR